MAPSNVVPAAEASHAGAAAEEAAHLADEEDETAMEGARAVPAPLPSQPTAEELEAHRVAHMVQDDGAMLVTSCCWQLNKIM